jgi:NodT family efflux transporter outer membrane factor (OMF) lipoprotein
MNVRRVLPFASVILVFGGCAVGPDYQRPGLASPAAFKEAGTWKVAQPADTLPRGRWWTIFGDPLLDELLAQVEVSNQNVRVAEARYRQAKAAAAGARAGLYPSLGASAGRTRAQSTFSTSGAGVAATNYNFQLDAAWEVDVWGRVRRLAESGDATAQAAEGDLAGALLSAQAALALDYFALRIVDAQKRVFDETVAAYERSLQLTRNRYTAGVASRADVVQAEAQLLSARAQSLDLATQRAQLEHAIAILVGKAPADFSLASDASYPKAPDVPLAVPSALLERRPDIAAAERRVAAANAQVGAAKAAFFPSLDLSASGGFRSPGLSDWFSIPHRFWSIGPSLALSVFDAGLRRSQSDQAIAAYDQSVATYRQAVLGAFGEVEDNLVALRVLGEEALVQQDALRSARESVALTLNQYKAGTVSYLNVVIAQANAFSEELSAIAIRNRQLAASVGLVRALGGGWSVPAGFPAR